MNGVDLGHRRSGAFLTTPHLLRLLALGSLSLDWGSRLAEVFVWISDFRAVDQFSQCHRGLALRLRLVPYLTCAGFSWVFFAFRLTLSSLVGLATSTVALRPEPIATL